MGLGHERRVFDAACELDVRKAGDVRSGTVGLALFREDQFRSMGSCKEKFERTGSTPRSAALASALMAVLQMRLHRTIVALKFALRHCHPPCSTFAYR